ncbi:inosose isomerase [Oceanobacillus oncorhynchi subsp. incaldanensis]|uniref:sugar phosphate isomerase/epimerase family protein n=1 Tax=Oceanobacillus oncorhynchi TaxID=545501 RepID=UPI001B0DABA6|nr:sugar phosphate isomerase/epimerase [Oceanobacillus oncorhynchi]GIO18977.1 inosose isomerase [Oceanobacillus oncorhynchi subsp. incaldanensis]
MKLCYNQATTLENSNLAKDLEYCEKHGYDYIEIRTMDKLPEYLRDHSMEELQDYFQNHHIKPIALNALVYFNNREDEEQVIEEFKTMVDNANELGAAYVVVVPLVTDQALLKEDIKVSAVSMLNQFADIAEAQDVKVALEFVGHPECTINTFEQAYDIIDTVDRKSVGLVFDCFHFHAMNSDFEFLKKADGEKIFILHIDDTEDYPVGVLRDEHRVWPGEGVIDLEKLLQTVKEIGYKEDLVSVELFRPEYYQMPAEEVIRKAKETTLESIAASIHS